MFNLAIMNDIKLQLAVYGQKTEDTSYNIILGSKTTCVPCISMARLAI